MTSAPLDLLHERRREQGLPDPLQEAAARRALILKGTAIGTGLLLLSVVITGLLLMRQQMLRAELDRLALVEAEVQATETRLTAANAKLKTVKDANRSLAQGLVNARSGSALLRDLQRRVPQGVQLVDVQVEGSGPALRISGAAADPMAFARINAFQIELARSPLLDPQNVKLIKAVRDGADSSTSSNRSAVATAASSLVTFELTAQFRPTMRATAELQLLNELGSKGMALRLQRLQAEGLLP